MKKSAIFISSLVSLVAFGQERSVAAGGDISGSSGSFSFTVGLPDYSNYSGASGSVSEGVQQPFELFSLGIEEWNTTIDFSVYPNPVSSYLTIDFPMKLEDVSYEIIDGTGRIVKDGKLLEMSNVISLQELAMANYHFVVKQHSTVLRTYQIIKHN